MNHTSPNNHADNTHVGDDVVGRVSKLKNGHIAVSRGGTARRRLRAACEAESVTVGTHLQILILSTLTPPVAADFILATARILVRRRSLTALANLGVCRIAASARTTARRPDGTQAPATAALLVQLLAHGRVVEAQGRVFGTAQAAGADGLGGGADGAVAAARLAWFFAGGRVVGALGRACRAAAVGLADGLARGATASVDGYALWESQISARLLTPSAGIGRSGTYANWGCNGAASAGTRD